MPDKIDISKNIKEQISQNHIKMRSKWFFIVEKLGLESGFLFSLLLGLAILCFVLYIMEQNGAFEFTEFGVQGLPVIFDNIPYDLVVAAIVLFALANYIIKQFDFSYRKPFYLFSCSALILISAVGIIMFWTGVNHLMMEKLASAPIVKNIASKKITNSPQGEKAIIGRIVKVGSGVVTLQTVDGKQLGIVINQKIERPLDVRFIPGQVIKIIGSKEGEKFKAKFISIIQSNNRFIKIVPIISPVPNASTSN